MIDRTFTVTELPHFRRLVEFVKDVEDLAHGIGDEEIIDMVDTLRGDLAQLMHEPEASA